MIDGSSILGMASVEDSDRALVPELASFRRWEDGIGLVMCDVPGVCSRSTLKRELGEIKMNVGFEPEFFLLRDSMHTDNANYGDAAGDDIRREIMAELEKIGIVPLTAHHERAPSQHEITYRYADALTSCDNLILGKLITERVAHRHGLVANFEPKPFEGVNGNGLHTNVSLWEGGKNTFASTSKHFMAGVLTHARALCFLTNPSVNSYKRLVAGYEAPVNITWGHRDRSSMIRIPRATGDAARIEIRNPDATMNPYLGVAAILRAGMDGVERKLLPPEVGTLPSSLEEAKTEFSKSELFSSLLHNLSHEKENR